MRLKSPFSKPESTYKNFLVTKSLFLEEIHIHLVELVHLPTGAKVIHLAADDPENLFCLSFKTLPTSSNGVAHVLEHTVLCGSKHFPIKDPFFGMMRRSLNTFMNAFTGSDFTCYPASSQIETDFYNLLEVYLDAAFYPELKKTSFLQEGHRLEFSDPNNLNSDLVYKGIVYNEMKGAMNSLDSRMWHSLMQNLFPDLPYRFESGGDPIEIPHLTYEELKEFHSFYYHPSHALFFFYGNLPLEKHLDYIEEKVLQHTEKKAPLEPIKMQPRFSSPKFVETFYPLSGNESLEEKSAFAFSFLTCPATDLETSMALTLLDSILMDTDASILRRPLLASGLCKQAGAAIDPEMSEIPWIFIFKGCAKEKKEELFALFKSNLEKIIANKEITKEMIEASLHQIEFQRLEISADHMPHGLSLFMRAALGTQHGCSAEHSLQIHSLFKRVEKNLEDSQYLPTLIKKYILDNPHQVHLTLIPDPKLTQKEEEREKKTLEEIKKKLTEEDKKRIAEQYLEMQRYHSEVEQQSLDILPKLPLEKVPNRVKYFSLEELQIGDMPIYLHRGATNKILYSDLIFDLPSFSKEELPYLSLFAALFAEMGTMQKNYQELLQYTHRYLGSVEGYLYFSPRYDNPDHLSPCFCIRAKALDRSTPRLFALMQEYMEGINWKDKSRLKELLYQFRTYADQSLFNKPLRFANHLSQSGRSQLGFIKEELYGLNYYHFLRELTTDVDNKLDALIQQLENIEKKVLSGPCKCVLSCDELTADKIIKEAEMLQPKQAKAITKFSFFPLTPLPPQGRAIPSSVSFSSLSFDTLCYADAQAPYLTLGSQLLENIYLHKKIREEGGAYGSGASLTTSTRGFNFFTYRDPHIASSIEACFRSIELAAKGSFTQRDLEEAKFGVLQDIDSPIPPSIQGITSYFWQRTGKTKEHREAYRRKIVEAEIKDIKEAFAKHLLHSKKVTLVTFADKKLLEKENTILKKKGLITLSEILSP